MYQKVQCTGCVCVCVYVEGVVGIDNLPRILDLGDKNHRKKQN